MTSATGMYSGDRGTLDDEDQFCMKYMNATEDGGQCKSTRAQGNVSFLLVGIPLPLLSLIVNAGVLLAAGLQRKTLRRHNYVFSSVCSTLVSNMLYATLCVWTSIANYIGFIEDSLKNSYNQTISEKLWIARNATIICLLLAMCGNIGSLVYVLMDSTYFVGRTVSKELIESGQFNGEQKSWRRVKFRLTKRRKAQILIALSWLIPACLVLAAILSDWHCVNCCCPPGIYYGDSCSKAAGCSRFWAPMTHSFLGVFFAMWLTEVILLTCLLAHATLKFRDMLADREIANQDDDVPSVQVEETGTATGLDATTPSDDSQKRESSGGAGKASGGKTNLAVTHEQKRGVSTITSDTLRRNISKKKHPNLKFARKLNSKMKSMMSLSVVFFVFTFSVAVGIVIDITTGSPMPGKNAVIIVSELSTYIYTLLCPLLLLKFMPRLKLSVIMCVYKCCKVFGR